MKKLWVLSAIMMLLTACQESLEDRCAREAKEYTRKNCPAKMDNNSILDSLTFERETHTLHYYYRLTGFADIRTITTVLPTPTARRKIRRRCCSTWCSQIKTINRNHELHELHEFEY